MSRRPIALSPDLRRLQNEGYDLDIRGGYLLVRDIPYANSSRAVRRGILISKLQLSGDVATKPADHVCYWTGEHPCHSDGSIIAAFQNPSEPRDLGDGLRADFTFSAKADYRDYHHKMTTYVARIAGEAAKIDPTATACTFPAIPAGGADCVFHYVDTATSRAGIGRVNSKLAGQRIGIIGLGGSGSYLLDLTAKTPVAEIHLFDRDVFSQHSAFRAPGAPTLEELQSRPQKVARFAEIYSRMRKGIVARDVFIDESNVKVLDGLDFVFIAIDNGPAKRPAVQHLVAKGIPFIDLGMGVTFEDGQLAGIVRTTLSTPDTRGLAEPHISYSDGDGGANEYATNIQIAELNALNAAMAVVAWKRHFGFYRDTRKAVYAGYSIASGEIVIEGVA